MLVNKDLEARSAYGLLLAIMGRFNFDTREQAREAFEERDVLERLKAGEDHKKITEELEGLAAIRSSERITF